MALIDFTKKILDFDGNAIPGIGDLTLGKACINALLFPPREPLSGEENMARFDLSRRIHKSASPAKLSAEDIVRVKQCAPLHYAPLVVGLIFEGLEGDEA